MEKKPKNPNRPASEPDPYADRISRRDFLVRAAGTTAVAGALTAGGYLIYDRVNPVRSRAASARGPRSFQVPAVPGHPRNVMIQGDDPRANLRAAMDKLGGLANFIKPGDRVLLKPNIAWDRTPELAANTNPDVVEEMVRLCRKAGARTVIVGDHTVADSSRTAENSGIKKAAEKSGARLVLVGKKTDFVNARIGGKVLNTWPVMKLMYQVDKVINLPAAKHHGLSRVTLGIKNWIGVAGGKRRDLHQDIHQTIVDLIMAFPPTLTIIDASKLLMKHGPTGGRLSDVKKSRFLVAGVDPATVDAAVLPLLEASLSEVRHVTEAMRRGLGSVKPDAVTRFDA